MAIMANLNDYMSGKKGLLDKPIEDLMARAFNTDTMKSVLKNDTARSALQFLVGDGSKRNDVMEAGSPYGKLATKLTDRAAVELLKQGMKVASKKGGTETEKAIARQFAKQLEMEGNILGNISKIATKGKAPKMVKGNRKIATEYGTGGKLTKGKGYKSRIEELQSKINPTGVKQLPESTTPGRLPQATQRFQSKLDKYGNRRSGGSFKTPKEKQLEKLQLQKEKEIALKRKATMESNQKKLVMKDRAGTVGRVALGGAAVGGLATGLHGDAARVPLADTSQEAYDRASAMPGPSSSGTGTQGASAPSIGIPQSETAVEPQSRGQQAGQLNTNISPATDTTTDTATATTAKADDDNKGGVVNWMKRLAPLIAGIGGTGIAAAIGGKDAALGYAQGFSGEYMKGQERNRQQAELERKEKRLDLKEATARMDDLLIAGAIAPAQAIFESMAGQYSDEEKNKWGDAFKEAQRLKDEGNNAQAFEKRMESLRIGAVFMKEGMMGPALESINRYAEPGKEITEDMLTEMRTKNMFETKYAEFKAQNMSDDKAVTAANKFVRNVVGGYVSSEQAKKRAKVEKALSTATTEEDIADLEKWSIGAESANLDAATIKQVSDKIAEIKERARRQREMQGTVTHTAGKIINRGAGAVGEGIGSLYDVGAGAVGNFYGGLTGQ
jgi:hypothetical protein